MLYILNYVILYYTLYMIHYTLYIKHYIYTYNQPFFEGYFLQNITLPSGNPSTATKKKCAVCSVPSDADHRAQMEALIHGFSVANASLERQTKA